MPASLCYLIGLILSDQLTLRWVTLLFFIPFPLLTVVWLRGRTRLRWLFWWGCLLFGWGWGSASLHPVMDFRLQDVVGELRVFAGRVLVATPDTQTPLEVALQEVDGAGPVSGRVLLYLPQEGRFAPGRFALLHQGDQIRFATKLKPPGWYKNWGGFNRRRSLARNGVLLQGTINAPEDLAVLKEGDTVWPSLRPLRGWIRNKINAATAPPDSALLISLVTGDRSGISPDVWQAFRDTGTAHLLAISGQHVGLVALIFYFPIFWLLKRSYRLMLALSVRSLATLLTLIPVTGYILLAGAPVSAIRAGVIVALLALALATHLAFDIFSGLALAALGICVVEPSAFFTASFQLSFAAVLALGLLASPLRKIILSTRCPSYLATLLATSVAAFLGTFPLLLFHFHQVSVSGILTNLWAVPMMGLILAGLMISLLLVPWSGVLLSLTGKLTHLFLWGIQWSARGALILTLNIPAGPRHDLKIHALDVGQGESTLIQTPGNHNLLVDAGGFQVSGKAVGPRPNAFDVGEKVVVPYLRYRGVKRIAALILSHPHPDHYGGMEAVLRYFPVDEFWWNGDRPKDPSFDHLLEVLRERQVPIVIMGEGSRRTFDQVDVHVFAPRGLASEAVNDNSLVIKVVLGQTSFLLTGDVERAGTERLLRGPADLRSDVLKIPHHGSLTSSSVAFIDAVMPQYAFVSAGEDNRFHLPNAQVLGRYQRRGVKVLRTDWQGALLFLSDGKRLKVKSFRDQPD